MFYFEDCGTFDRHSIRCRSANIEFSSRPKEQKTVENDHQVLVKENRRIEISCFVGRRRSNDSNLRTVDKADHRNNFDYETSPLVRKSKSTIPIDCNNCPSGNIRCYFHRDSTKPVKWRARGNRETCRQCTNWMIDTNIFLQLVKCQLWYIDQLF